MQGGRRGGDSHHFMAGPALDGHGSILAVARLSAVPCQYCHVRASDTQKTCGEGQGSDDLQTPRPYTCLGILDAMGKPHLHHSRLALLHPGRGQDCRRGPGQ